MEITCGKCHHQFQESSEFLLKKGPLFVYYKCPQCGKVITIKLDTSTFKASSTESKTPGSKAANGSEEGIPVFISSSVRQQLYDLGYSNADVDTMTPNKAQTILRTQSTKDAPEPGVRIPQPRTVKEVAGWLIVHDELTKPQTFDLPEGKYLIGRKSSMPVDISIETADKTMSREHCLLEVRLNRATGDYDALIKDFKSTNGTILNGSIRQRKLEKGDEFYLNDGDIFQLGLTKIVYRKNHGVEKKATVVKQVLEQDYIPTVALDPEMLKKYLHKP
jgi:predicted RNA-binding Zn-ribbon protein involved in translation (DUF1610 family)